MLGFGFGVSVASPRSDNFQKMSNVEGGEGWDEVMEERIKGVESLTAVANCCNQFWILGSVAPSPCG